jgi:hypothetical protein
MEVLTNFTINNSRDIYNALERLDQAFYVAPQPKYAENHVFDEDQSVRWNREEVVRRNAERAEIYKHARELKAQSCANFEEAVINYIMQDLSYSYSFSRVEAIALLRAVRFHHESEWWNWLDDMAETVIDLYAAKEGVDLKSET